MDNDDDDWVGEPEGRHSRERADPAFWSGQRPPQHRWPRASGSCSSLLLVVLLYFYTLGLMARILFAPFSIAGSLIAGFVARKVFDRHLDRRSTTRSRPRRARSASRFALVLMAAMLQAAVFAQAPAPCSTARLGGRSAASPERGQGAKDKA